MPAIAALAHDLHRWSRERFHDPAHTPAQRAHAQALLQLLIAQDGSATRLCEVIAGAPLGLQVRQAVTSAVPPIVRAQLPGTAFLERYSTLGAQMVPAHGALWFAAQTLLNPYATFVYNYFVRGGFLDGAAGFKYHAWHSAYISWKYAKARQLQMAQPK